MNRTTKSRNLYPHPFSRAYWLDAMAELKDVKMLVFAALIIALRVVLKLVAIPLAPNLKINTSFLANALGAMVYGPVVAALSAIVSDVLGVMITGDQYFPPFVLTEIASSVLFALFLYRARVTTARVMLSRLSICIVVNVLIQTPIMMLFYRMMLGGKAYTFEMAIPGIIKNLFMFPIESVVLTVFLAAIQPISCRMGLTYRGDHSLKFTKSQMGVLVLLTVFGTGCVLGYLTYHYQHTSLTTGYSMEERAEKNRLMDQIIKSKTDAAEGPTVSIIESSYKDFGGRDVTYNVAYYAADPEKAGAEEMEQLWCLKKTPARKHEALTRMGTAVIVIDEKAHEILSFDYTPEETSGVQIS